MRVVGCFVDLVASSIKQYPPINFPDKLTHYIEFSIFSFKTSIIIFYEKIQIQNYLQILIVI